MRLIPCQIEYKSTWLSLCLWVSNSYLRISSMTTLLILAMHNVHRIRLRYLYTGRTKILTTIILCKLRNHTFNFRLKSQSNPRIQTLFHEDGKKIPAFAENIDKEWSWINNMLINAVDPLFNYEQLKN